MSRHRIITAAILACVVAAVSAAAGIGWQQHQAAAVHAAPRDAVCWLPTFDEGYTENPGVTVQVHCVNTGKPAMPAQIAAAHYAPQCAPNTSRVPCYHPCYAYTPGVPYPYHVVPCPSDSHPHLRYALGYR